MATFQLHHQTLITIEYQRQSLSFRGAALEAALRGHAGPHVHCRSAACAAQVWRARHERDAAVARARQLAAALAAHGLQPPPRRLASAAELLDRQHDATRPRMLHARTLLPRDQRADLLPDLERPLSCGDLRDR
ncbi:hypothetical protein EVAR_75107_1 [Eumeta japonica]|uniref:Uncharacterized protein n=1 Tax=Eumeta variegata TaxID=151549 RepID=A0A4C1U0F8_EUMVA|nr:hypothetical protein EVAR_75107_1 [Eumeta japonica]